MITRISSTDAANDLIEKLRSEHGPIMFHQSGGCCDGSSPMCYPDGEFYLGSSDVCLGEVNGVSFYMSASQFEYWEAHTHHLRCDSWYRWAIFIRAPNGFKIFY